jgi:hypothetical protein
LQHHLPLEPASPRARSAETTSFQTPQDSLSRSGCMGTGHVAGLVVEQRGCLLRRMSLLLAQVGSHGRRPRRRLSGVNLPPRDRARDRRPSAAVQSIELVRITPIPGSNLSIKRPGQTLARRLRAQCRAGRARSRPGRGYDALGRDGVAGSAALRLYLLAMFLSPLLPG